MASAGRNSSGKMPDESVVFRCPIPRLKLWESLENCPWVFYGLKLARSVRSGNVCFRFQLERSYRSTNKWAIVKLYEISPHGFSVQKITLKIYIDKVSVQVKAFKQQSDGFHFCSIDPDLFFESGKVVAKVIVTLGPLIEEERSFSTEIAKKFESELQNPVLADVILECNGVELKCHSFILAARSDYFDTALSQAGFIEAQTRRIKIKDMDVEILRQVVKFLYTDKFDVSDDTLPALFTAADRFNVPSLRMQCLRLFTVNKISLPMAADCFALAYLHNLEDLRKKTARLIQDNFEAVRGTPAWNVVQSDKAMMNQFLSDAFHKK